MIYLGVLFAAVVAAVGWKLTARGAYETAEYVVLETSGSFEIREYPDLAMATTSMKLESQGDDGSFMRLFGYISGNNDAQQKVAMTTPVFMESASDQQSGQMGFVIPKKISEQNIPAPTSSSVEIRQRPGGRFAVIRFSGRTDPRSLADAEQKLRLWMESGGWTGIGAAEVAGYDPPWTPGPFRRNEILVRIDPAPQRD